MDGDLIGSDCKSSGFVSVIRVFCKKKIMSCENDTRSTWKKILYAQLMGNLKMHKMAHELYVCLEVWLRLFFKELFVLKCIKIIFFYF
jgi:hypothetical protein